MAEYFCNGNVSFGNPDGLEGCCWDCRYMQPETNEKCMELWRKKKAPKPAHPGGKNNE